MIKRLIKESFDLFCRMNWLRQINRVLKKRDRAYNNYVRHKYVARAMLIRYNELYGENKPNP